MQSKDISWILGEEKFLNQGEIRRLYRDCEKLAKNCSAVAVREFFLVDLAMSTGLRVSEVRHLNCGDIGKHSLMVINGKCGKNRIVRFSTDFARHYEKYKQWKQGIGESLKNEAPLITNGRGGCMSVRGLQKMFERCLRRSGIEGHSIHHARHTYATFLLKASNNNLRMVQKQLGHSSITLTVDTYTHWMPGKNREAMDRLPVNHEQAL